MIEEVSSGLSVPAMRALALEALALRGLQVCTRCNVPKPKSAFGARRRQCTKCRVEVNRAWVEGHRERDRENKRRWELRNPEALRASALASAAKSRANASPEDRQAANAAQRQYRAKLRDVALDRYGGKCACCGEATREFLAIDHKHNNGNVHRKQLRVTGSSLYLWLRRHGYPPDFQVLCHNCNLAKGFYGCCPHANS